MKKKMYEKPTMEVLECEQEVQLLAGSGVGAMRSGYGTADEDTWEEE